jgi:hypothetical protein
MHTIAYLLNNKEYIKEMHSAGDAHSTPAELLINSIGD